MEIFVSMLYLSSYSSYIYRNIKRKQLKKKHIYGENMQFSTFIFSVDVNYA